MTRNQRLRSRYDIMITIPNRFGFEGRCITARVRVRLSREQRNKAHHCRAGHQQGPDPSHSLTVAAG